MVDEIQGRSRKRFRAAKLFLIFGEPWSIFLGISTSSRSTFLVIFLRLDRSNSAQRTNRK